MMYEHKAKRKDNGEWITGWLAQSLPGTKYTDYSIYDHFGDGAVVLDKETICRPTYKMDEEGHYTFENDRIRDSYNRLGTIFLDEKEARWMIKFDDGEIDSLNIRFEVTGENIYD